MSDRLTQEMRKDIISRMVNYAFKSKLADAKALVEAAALEVVETPQTLSLPPSLVKDGWIKSDNSILIEFLDSRGKIVNSSRYGFELTKRVPIKAEAYHHSISAKADMKSPLYKAYLSYDRLKDERTELADSLKSILSSVSTTRKLLEILPAAKDFIPELMEARSLVAIETINKVSAYFTSKEA